MQTSEIQARRYAAGRCCICKEDINFEIDSNAVAINPEGFDPCALVIVTNAFGAYDGQREQEFPCHMECFRKVVGDDYLYIIEPDFETHGEVKREQEREAAELAEATVKGAEPPAA